MSIEDEPGSGERRERSAGVENRGGQAGQGKDADNEKGEKHRGRSDADLHGGPGAHRKDAQEQRGQKDRGSGRSAPDRAAPDREGGSGRKHIGGNDE
jgi:hypothetical protein